MSRPISATLLQAVYNQESEQVYLALLEITHTDLAAPIRVVCNHVQVTHDGDVYLPFFFEITLPQETEDRIGNVQLVIDNVDRSIVLAIRTITSPAEVTFRAVLASDPDTVEIELSGLALRNVTYDANFVRGELVYEERLLNQVPQDLFTPQNCQGVH